MPNILNPDGTLNENAGPYQGQTVLEAREAVVADLEKQGLVVRVEDREIDWPLRPFQDSYRAVPGRSMVREDGAVAQMAMDAVIDGRVRIIPNVTRKAISIGLAKSATGPSDASFGGGIRFQSGTAVPSPSGTGGSIAGRDDIAWHWDDEHQQWWICAQESEPGRGRRAGAQTRPRGGVLDTWFARRCGRTRPCGWPEQTPELKYYYRPTCSSPAAT